MRGELVASGPYPSPLILGGESVQNLVSESVFNHFSGIEPVVPLAVLCDGFGFLTGLLGVDAVDLVTEPEYVLASISRSVAWPSSTPLSRGWCIRFSLLGRQ